MNVTLGTCFFFSAPMRGIFLTSFSLQAILVWRKIARSTAVRLEVFRGHNLTQRCIFPILNRMFF